MTDTRKEFEKHSGLGVTELTKAKDNPDVVDGEYIYGHVSYAWRSWQACQSLNDKRIENYKSAYETWQDKTEWVQETSTAKELGLHRADVLKKRIEQLLAVIAKKDEALKNVVGWQSKPIRQSIVNEAIAIKPENVELVEVGVVTSTGMVFFYNKAISPKYGDKIYTIKQKASQP